MASSHSSNTIHSSIPKPPFIFFTRVINFSCHLLFNLFPALPFFSLFDSSSPYFPLSSSLPASIPLGSATSKVSLTIYKLLCRHCSSFTTSTFFSLSFPLWFLPVLPPLPIPHLNSLINSPLHLQSIILARASFRLPPFHFPLPHTFHLTKQFSPMPRPVLFPLFPAYQIHIRSTLRPS